MIFLVALACLGVGAGAGFAIRGKGNSDAAQASEREAKLLLEEAKNKSEAMTRAAELEAKEKVLNGQSSLEAEIRKGREQLEEEERELRRRESGLDERARRLDSLEEELRGKDAEIRSLERGTEEAHRLAQDKVQEAETQLSEIAGLTKEAAREALVESVRAEAHLEAGKRVKRIEEEAREQSDRRARRIIAMAIQRYAGEYVTERTVSVVHLPNEEMKGRIIGREGRNIRALEAATGIDLIIDDTPEAVILSGFNPLRREIARRSLERLIADGRIHPSRVEEVVAKVQEEMEVVVREAGEQAAFDLGLHEIHPEILRLIGQLKFRTSYGQNQYKHALEVAFLAGMMAAELDLDPRIARRAGLLHDIGKVIDQSMEGSHAVIGAEFAKKYGETPQVVNAIASHHEEVAKESVYSVLVQASDALSGARPGARREILEGYVRRLEDLESISNSFPGVERSYAIQAGREIRIVVSNQGVSDSEAIMMSRDIAQRIESELTYPGQIKVTVIRETRAVEYAR